MKALKILVAVPSGTHWIADFAVSMISMVAYFAGNRVPGWDANELRVMNIKGSILPKQRLDALKAAKAWGATHLLYVDSDHTFPPDMLHQLLRHGKDVMAANCVTKTIPCMTTGRTKSEGVQGVPVFSDHDSVGIQRVWRIGTGVMLLSRKAFEQIPHDAFSMVYKPDADTYQGEDWTMCDALDKLGVPIYVDHKLSRQVGHVGMFEYTHDYVGEVVAKEV